MAILDPGDIGAEQAATLFDIALGKTLCLSDGSCAVAD